ncbi:MAG: pilus assembly protein PilM [Planctomycetota bacterium]
MAKTLGIHLAGRRFQLVALDGTFKKPKVRLCLSGVAPRDEEASPNELLADELRSTAKEHRKQLASDNIGLSVDSSMATFRGLSLPFAEPAKIEEVLKFEVENQLPQWDIDSVVVDFHVVHGTPVESQLLVTAVPKDELGERIDAAARAGLEPYDAEIEATALFRAAEQQGVLGEESAQCLVHFGARTTTLVVAAEGRLTSMRALHLELGALDDADTVTATDSDGDGKLEVAREEVQEVVSDDRIRAVRERVQRELARTMGSSRAEVDFDAILVCGIEIDGLVGTSVQDVPIQRLDPLEGLVELPEKERSRLVIAFGTALGRLGGSAVKPHLRREELTYASKFERLELPLGVLGLLTLTLLSALYIVNGKVLQARELDVRRWMQASQNFMIGEEGNTSIVGALRPTKDEYASDPLYSYVAKIAKAGDDKRSYSQQLSKVEQLMDQKIRGLEEELGAARDLTLPQSAMTGLNLVLDVLRDLADEESVGRFSIRNARARYVEGRRGKDDTVLVELDLTFFGANDAIGSESYSTFFNALEDQVWLADELDRPTTSTLDNGQGIYLNGLKIAVDTSLAEVEG